MNDIIKGVVEMEERVNELESKVTTLTQYIDSLNIQLNNKVDKNKVIAAINLSDEGIRIIGKRIHLDGGTMVDAEYKPVRAKNLYIEPKGEGKAWVLKTSQLDRIEEKLDKLLDLIKDKELVTKIDNGTISAKKINMINNNH